MSIGKHNLGLFFNGSLTYSSLIGGLISLTLAIVSAVYMFNILFSIIRRDTYTVVYSIEEADESSKLFDYSLANLPVFTQLVIRFQGLDSTYCNQTTLIIRYEDDQLLQQVGSFEITDYVGLEPLSNETKCFFIPSKNQDYQTKIEPYLNNTAFFLQDGKYKYSLEYYLRGYQRIELLYVSIQIQSNLISNTGITSTSSWIHFERNKNQCEMALTLIEYVSSDSIIGFKSDFNESILIQDYDPICVNSSLMGSNLNLYFQSPNAMNKYVRQPTLLLYAVIQLGGLFGFIRLLAMLIQIIHQKLFERSLSKQLKKQQKKPIFKNDDGNTSPRYKNQFSNFDSQSNNDLQSNLMGGTQTITSQDTFYVGKKDSIQQIYSFKSMIKLKMNQDEQDRRLDRLEQLLAVRDKEIIEIKEENEYLKSSMSGYAKRDGFPNSNLNSQYPLSGQVVATEHHLNINESNIDSTSQVVDAMDDRYDKANFNSNQLKIKRKDTDIKYELGNQIEQMKIQLQFLTQQYQQLEGKFQKDKQE